MASERLALLVTLNANQAINGFSKIGSTASAQLGRAEKGMSRFKAASNAALGSIAQQLPGVGSTAAALERMGVGSASTASKMALLAGGAAAAGAAIVAFGKVSVSTFTSSALAAGKMADATGLSVEQASRWREAADDLGISGDTVSRAFSKMTVAIGKNPEVLNKFGVEVEYARDGTVNLNKTMLNVIDTLNATKDPTKRAALAQQAFGRGYAEVAELITMSAGDVRAALDGVSDARVIDAEELRKARQYREAMDNLGDAVKDLSMEFGERLTPSISRAADRLTWFIDKAGDLEKAAGGKDPFSGLFAGLRDLPVLGPALRLVDTMDQVRDAVDDTTESVSKSGQAFGGVWPGVTSQAAQAAFAIDDTADSADKAADKFDTLAQKVSRTRSELEALGGANRDAAAADIAYRDAIASTTEAVDKATEATVASQTAMAEHGAASAEATTAAADQADAARNVEKALLDQANASLELVSATFNQTKSVDGATLAMMAARSEFVRSATQAGLTADAANRLADEYGLIPRDVKTKVSQSGAQQVSADLARVRDYALGIPTSRLIRVSADTAMAMIALDRVAYRMRQINNGVMLRVGSYAGGTKFHPGGVALVGEQGPELVNLPRGAEVHTAQQTRAMIGSAELLTRELPSGGGSAGPAVNLTVNMGLVTDPQATARAIEDLMRRYSSRTGRPTLVAA